MQILDLLILFLLVNSNYANHCICTMYLKFGMRNSCMSCTMRAQYCASNAENTLRGKRQSRKKVVIASFLVVRAGNQFSHWLRRRPKTWRRCSSCANCSSPSLSTIVCSRSFSRFLFPEHSNSITGALIIQESSFSRISPTGVRWLITTPFCTTSCTTFLSRNRL